MLNIFFNVNKLLHNLHSLQRIVGVISAKYYYVKIAVAAKPYISLIQSILF